MKRMGIKGSLLGMLMLGAAGCVDTGSDNNDMGMSGEPFVPPATMTPATMTPATTPVAGMPPTATPAAGTPAAPAPATTPMEGMAPAAGTPAAPAPMDGAGTPMETPIAGAPAPVDGMMPPAELISIAGTAPMASCLSYQKPANGMCGSHYCGVTVEQLGMALDPANVCGSDPQVICDAEVVDVVTNCARNVGLANPLMALGVMGNEQAAADFLAADTETCVQAEPSGAELPMACRECFVKVAVCAATFCGVECLGTTEQEMMNCDACRQMNGCEGRLFDCSGLPNPL